MESVPHFSTSDFKSQFFTNTKNPDLLFREDADNFFIAPFKAFKNLMLLPVPFYRRSITQVYLVTKGEMKKKCNLNQVTIKKGQAHIWLQDQIAAVDYFSDDIEGFYCHFNIDFLIQSKFTTKVMQDFLPLNNFMESNAITLDADAIATMTSSLKRMHYSYLHDYSPKKIRAYLLSVLYEINDQLPHQPIEKNVINRQTKLVNDFKQLLMDYNTKEQSITFYASKLGVSPNHLNKTVKQFTGKSTKMWMNESLIMGAKVLLKQSNLSIQEIGYTLGFTDPSYFTRFFKKHTGKSPSVFVNEK
ncbi:helix-turn-helix domain-containing protein [Tenacibaculum sp. 190524A02b]|uniref:AraC family transcriptional regulator, transcriptional activator of pobA n=1 Tax=Tenacibaculum vairaonense TaxID=3137860 RepID=A0ABM9PKQ8_9FLAO